MGHTSVRRRGHDCWPRCGSSSCLPVVVVGVDCVFHKSVRRCGCGCWPWCGLSWWPLPLLMACASLVFDVVGVVVGRGLVCRVTCSRPLAWRHPSGFAGVSFATVLGLVVGLLACCLLVVVVGVDGVCHTGVRGCGCVRWSLFGSPRRLLMAVVGVDGLGSSCIRGCGYVRWPRIGSLCWPSLWSMVCSTRVFDGVGVVAGRGVGCGEGRACGRLTGL